MYLSYVYNSCIFYSSNTYIPCMSIILGKTNTVGIKGNYN